MPVYLIGAGARGVFDVDSACRFDAVLSIPLGEMTPPAPIMCPRHCRVDAADCDACAHLRGRRDGTLLCSASDGDPVADWLTRSPPSTTIETPCRAAEALAGSHGVHHLLVYDAQRSLVGIACRCDLARGAPGAPVARVMTRDVFAVAPTTSIGVAVTAMRALRIGCLPVVSDLLVLGILTRGNLLRAGMPESAV